MPNDEEESEDVRERFHGGYRELRSKLAELDSKFQNLVGTLIVFRWFGIAAIGVIGSIGWTTCTRAIDNEAALSLNSAKILAMEARVSALELTGSSTAKSAQAQVTDLVQRFNNFLLRYDLFVKEEVQNDAKSAENTNDIKELESFKHEIEEQGSPILREVMKEVGDLKIDLREQKAEVKALANVFLRYEQENEKKK